MKSLRIGGLCLVVMSVVMGAFAASAFAAGPEFQVENTKTHLLEPVKKPVAFKQSGAGSTLSSGSTLELSCVSSSGKGKLTGPKALSEKIVYSGCENAAAAKCQSGKTAGEIKSSKLVGTLVYASKGTTLVPAIEIAPASGTTVFKYSCGTKVKSVVSGQILGAVGPLESSSTELTETFAEGEEPAPGCGTQEIQLIEGMGPCRHLELEPEPAANKKVEAKKETTKKEFVGHVSLLK